MTVRKTLCPVADIPDGGALAIEVSSADRSMACDSLILTRHGDAVRGYANVCPHAGRRLDWSPGRFLIENGFLICAAHGAMFALASGECVSGPCRGVSLRAVPIEVVAGEVHAS